MSEPNASTTKPSEKFYVYFIQATEGGPIKIGRANDLQKRLKSIQTGSWQVLTVRHYFEFDTVEDAIVTEAELHEWFQAYRLVGEWFHAIEELATMAHGIPADTPYQPPLGYKPRRRGRPSRESLIACLDYRYVPTPEEIEYCKPENLRRVMEEMTASIGEITDSDLDEYDKEIDLLADNLGISLPL